MRARLLVGAAAAGLALAACQPLARGDAGTELRERDRVQQEIDEQARRHAQQNAGRGS